MGSNFLVCRTEFDQRMFSYAQAIPVALHVRLNDCTFLFFISRSSVNFPRIKAHPKLKGIFNP